MKRPVRNVRALFRIYHRGGSVQYEILALYLDQQKRTVMNTATYQRMMIMTYIDEFINRTTVYLIQGGETSHAHTIRRDERYYYYSSKPRIGMLLTPGTTLRTGIGRGTFLGQRSFFKSSIHSYGVPMS